MYKNNVRFERNVIYGTFVHILFVTKMFKQFFIVAVISVVVDRASAQFKALEFGSTEGPWDLPLWDRDMAPHVQQSFRTLAGRTGNVSPEKLKKI